MDGQQHPETPHPEHAHTEASIGARYHDLITRLVPRFLDEHGFTYSELAKIACIERTTLSRFLSGEKSHIPLRRRPRRLAQMELLERICSQEKVITDHHQLGRTVPRDRDGDYEIWFRNFSQRLLRLEHGPAARCLCLIPEFYAQSLQAPAPWGASMCSNTVFMVLVQLFKTDVEDASPELLEDALRWVDELYERVFVVATERYRSGHAHAPIGYAGNAWMRLGSMLQRDDLIERGLDHCLRAVGLAHDPLYCHWPNLLGALERILQSGHERATEWSQQVVDEARRHPEDRILAAFDKMHVPLVHAQWREQAPELSDVLDRARFRSRAVQAALESPLPLDARAATS